MKKKTTDLAFNMLGAVDIFSTQFDICDLVLKKGETKAFTLL